MNYRGFIKKKYLSLKFSEPIVLPITVLIIFLAFQGIRNYIEGIDIKDILAGLNSLLLISFFFLITFYVDTKEKLENFIEFILLCGFLSSLVALYQYFTNSILSGSNVVMTAITNRVYHPGGTLMTVCLFILTSAYLVKGSVKKINFHLFYVPFYIVGIATTLHRSLITLSVFGLLIIYIIHLLSSKFSFKRLAISVSILAVFGYFLSSTNLFDIIIFRLSSGQNEMQRNEGNYAYRFLIINNTFYAIGKESPAFGRGFNYNSDMSKTFDPFAISADADYGNFVLVFGFSGLIFLALIYIQMLYIGIKSFLRSKLLFDKAIFLAMIPVPILFIGLGFFSQIFFYTPNLILLIFCAGILYQVNNLNKKVYDSKNF
jgi:hypothetical protein